MLLPYVKETERLLDGLVKKYDEYGEAHIFPSLDIGFPNMCCVWQVVLRQEC